MCRTVWLSIRKKWKTRVFCTCAECGITKTRFVKNQNQTKGSRRGRKRENQISPHEGGGGAH